MTFEMPPIMILMCGWPEVPRAISRESRQAVTPARVTASAATTPTVLFRRMSDHSVRGVGGGRRAPPQQPALQRTDAPLREQRDHGDDQHPGVDTGRVERALRVGDQEAHAGLGAGVLTDDRADQRE